VTIPVEAEFWTRDLPAAHATMARLDSFELDEVLRAASKAMGMSISMPLHID
jgi:hypothetical protein